MSADDGAPVVRLGQMTRIAIIGLFTFAVIAALYISAAILIPIVLSLLLNVLLSPIVRFFANRGVPAPVPAFFLVAALVASFVSIGGILADPAEKWLVDAPKTMKVLQAKLLRQPENLSNLRQLAKEVDDLTAIDAQAGAQAVVVKEPGLIKSVVGGLPAAASFIAIVVFLTFFLLASGSTLLRRMTYCGRTFGQRRRIVQMARDIQSDLSLYLITITAINVTLGVAVSALMMALGMPNPMLWGAMAAVFNFAPYVGALASACVLLLVSVTTFDTVGSILIVPSSFVALTLCEGQLITPAVLGRRMSLSPIFIFLAVVFWGWLWGIAGALMAIPIMTCLMVVFDYIPGLRPIARFVRGRKQTRDDALPLDRSRAATPADDSEAAREEAA